MVEKLRHRSNRLGYRLGVGNSDPAELWFSVGNNWSDWNATLSAAIMNTGTWYHVVGTYDGDTIRCYVNGVEGSSTPYANGITDSAASLAIGRDGAGREFDGLIDEVAVWNDVLDPSAIAALYNSGNGLNASVNSGDYDEYVDNLVGYWQFNEGSGSTTADSSSSSNTGTLYGPSWDPSSIGSAPPASPSGAIFKFK